MQRLNTGSGLLRMEDRGQRSHKKQKSKRLWGEKLLHTLVEQVVWGIYWSSVREQDIYELLTHRSTAQNLKEKKNYHHILNNNKITSNTAL